MPDDYDSPWKEILHRLFPDAMALMLPEAYEDVDWPRGWESLDKDLKKLLPDAEASNRWADKLIRVYLKDGDEQLVYLHVEVQAGRDAALPLRMFTTNYRIFDRYQTPVVSLAILADDSPGWRPESYGWDVWGCRVGIDFPAVKLWDYNEDWKRLEALASDNPFAVAVMAHVKTMASRKSPAIRYEWKLELIQRLFESGYSDLEVGYVLRFIDWVMKLPEDLEDCLAADVERLEVKKMQYVTTWERRALKKGVRGVLERLATRRFGELPEWADRRLREAGTEALETWTDRILDAESLEDLFADTADATT